VLAAPAEARARADRGRRTVLDAHTCRHRVDDLLGLVAALAGGEPQTEVA
jgi:spore maturation protein CgeB